VVVAKTTAVPQTTAKDSGEVRLRRLRVLKGISPMNVQGYRHEMCGPSFQVGAKMMVFLDGDGTQLWADAASTNLVAALVAWRRATTEELRRKLLTKWKNGRPGTLQLSAAARLELMDQRATDAGGVANGNASATPTSIETAPTGPVSVDRWRAAAPGWKAPGTAKAAEARLEALWPALIDAAGAKLGAFAALVPSSCSRWASALTAAAAAKQVRAAAGPMGGDPSVLGSLAALDALGDAKVWSASCSHHFDTMFAYLRASDGALVMLWLPPEG
jgi:hypothetical protein